MPPYPLNNHEEIVQKLYIMFRDIPFYDRLIADKIRQIVLDADRLEINARTTAKLAQIYFGKREDFVGKEGKMVLYQINVAVRCCYVLLLSYNPAIAEAHFMNMEQLLEKYPQFRDEDDREKELLLRFRNMMALALTIIPAANNKEKLMDIVGRLEGAGRRYITGGGATQSTKRRAEIFQEESDLKPVQRGSRQRKPKELGRESRTVPTSWQKIHSLTIEKLQNQPFMMRPNSSSSSLDTAGIAADNQLVETLSSEGTISIDKKRPRAPMESSSFEKKKPRRPTKTSMLVKASSEKEDDSIEEKIPKELFATCPRFDSFFAVRYDKQDSLIRNNLLKEVENEPISDRLDILAQAAEKIEQQNKLVHFISSSALPGAAPPLLQERSDSFKLSRETSTTVDSIGSGELFTRDFSTFSYQSVEM